MKDTAAAAGGGADAEAEETGQLFAQRSAPLASAADRLASEGEQQQQPAQEVGNFEEAFASAANHIFQQHQPVSASRTRGRKAPPLEETADVVEEDFEEEDAPEQAMHHQLVHEKSNNGGNAANSPVQVVNGPAAYDDGDDLVDEPVEEARMAHSRGKCKLISRSYNSCSGSRWYWSLNERNTK